jgi:hypothetical protein
MEKEFCILKMELFIKGNLKMVHIMIMANCSGKMEMCMMGVGKKEGWMALDFLKGMMGLH